LLGWQANFKFNFLHCKAAKKFKKQKRMLALNIFLKPSNERKYIYNSKISLGRPGPAELRQIEKSNKKFHFPFMLS
jgi:hypothetical protein